MNMNQFTQKSLEAIQAAQSLAVEYGNQQIEQPHLLCALIGQEGGFTVVSAAETEIAANDNEVTISIRETTRLNAFLNIFFFLL